MDSSARGGAIVFVRVLITGAFIMAASAPTGFAQDCRGYGDHPATLHVLMNQKAPAKDLSVSWVAEEIRAIWAPCLEIVVAMGQEACPSCTDEIRVRIDDSPSRSGDALGWINFENGQPTRDIAVSLLRTRQLLRNASWMGLPISALPTPVAMRVLAQGVGRAIAHEIGHYVLRSASHQPTGLMRAVFSADDIVQPRRD